MKDEKNANVIHVVNQHDFIPQHFKSKRLSDIEIFEKSRIPLINSCFIHHSGRQFACVFDNCTDKNYCFKNGANLNNHHFHALRFHAGDRKLWCKNLYPDILKFVKIHDTSKIEDYRFSFNHRYFLADGNVSQFLHEGVVMLNSNRNPIIKFDMFTEIGDIKSDNSMVLNLFRYSDEYGFQKMFNKTYTNGKRKVLSEREIEIIRFCQQGLSSKMIAEKLNLSIHTIKNHKRNSMTKTSTHNITELIHYCFKNNWL